MIKLEVIICHYDDGNLIKIQTSPLGSLVMAPMGAVQHIPLHFAKSYIPEKALP